MADNVSDLEIEPTSFFHILFLKSLFLPQISKGWLLPLGFPEKPIGPPKQPHFKLGNLTPVK